MGHFRLEATINRAADEVFGVLTDLDRHAEWQPSTLESRRTSEGAVQLGTRARKVRKTPMGRVEFNTEVTDYDPDTRVYTETTLDSMVKGSTARWEVVAEGARSRVLVDADIKPRGPAKAMDAFITSTARKDFEGALEGLRSRLESS